MDLDREVAVIGDDTPSRTDMFERAGADGGGGDAVLGEVSWKAPEGVARTSTIEAPPVVEPQPTPPTEPASVPERAPEKTLERAPASGEAASGEHALVLRSGGRWVAGLQPTRSGTGEVFFGPPTQEEAAMAAVTRRLRGRTDRIQAFAQAEVEATQEPERAMFQLDSYRVGVFNRLLETHWCLKERLAAKEEELRTARTRLIQASFHYDRLIPDAGRLGAEVERARAQATGARRALDEASQLQEQLAGDKGRLEAEVERLKAEAAKVVEAQRALAEADQQHGKLADDKGQLQAEVDRLKALVATAEETRQGETRCREEAVKAAEERTPS
nr:uncharacterized protein LOC109771650 [Aegilops tauschii subsp. strangulata]